MKPFKTDVATVGFSNPTQPFKMSDSRIRPTAPKGHLKLKPPFRLNAADVAWALPANKTKDVGRIFESDVIRAFVGYGYPNTAPKVV